MNEEFITINTAETATATRVNIKYEPYPLVEEKDPILKQKVPEFDFESNINAKELVGRLTETLKVHRAYGIAAPQCGLPYRVFIIGAEDEYITMFNPEIVSFSEETSLLDEGCLSFPFMILNIIRPKTVTVSFQDDSGIDKQLTLSGISARIVQHELDHLNGITFDTVVKPLALKMGLKKREKQIKRFARELVSRNVKFK
jgi:peptide deformylase